MIVGVELLAILFNAFLFGVISQQLYTYSLGGFKDSMRMKIFVSAQYAVIAFQSIMLWQLTWRYFVADSGIAENVKARAWQVPVSSGCQCTLVLSANIFLANRIHALTRRRLKSGVIVALSIGAFGFGVATALLTWFGGPVRDATLQTVISAFWHGLQAIAECFITYSLTRALLNSRTGIQQSDSVVYYLIRRVVQMGFFAMIWAVLGLVAFIFMPTVCSFFEMTAGSIYTHVIFDMLQSRRKLHEHMAERSHTDMALTAQLPSRNFDRKGARVSPGPADSNISVMSTADLDLALETARQSTRRVSRDDVSEIECVPVGQPGVRYEFSYAHFLGES